MAGMGTTNSFLLKISNIFCFTAYLKRCIFFRGRTRNVADYFADLGYYVVVPKLLQPAMEGATDDDGYLNVCSLPIGSCDLKFSSLCRSC